MPTTPRLTRPPRLSSPLLSPSVPSPPVVRRHGTMGGQLSSRPKVILASQTHAYMRFVRSGSQNVFGLSISSCDDRTSIAPSADRSYLATASLIACLHHSSILLHLFLLCAFSLTHNLAALVASLRRAAVPDRVRHGGHQARRKLRRHPGTSAARSPPCDPTLSLVPVHTCVTRSPPCDPTLSLVPVHTCVTPFSVPALPFGAKRAPTSAHVQVCLPALCTLSHTAVSCYSLAQTFFRAMPLV
jgi:hypothetical protein